MKFRHFLVIVLTLALFSGCSSVETKKSETLSKTLSNPQPIKVASAQTSPLPPSTNPPQSLGAVPYFRPPSELTICGESVPINRPDVLERFDREFTIVVYSHAQVYLWLKRAERYFPLLEQQLKAKGFPEDIKYLIVAESDLLPNSKSSAGAAGIWQFIPSTGSRYGLKVTSHFDERYDYEKSTDGALKYLSYLYNRFKSWSLAMAAYNCGEERVSQEMQKQRVNNYYDLKLPLETERYVFRIIAIKEVLSNPEKYGYQFIKGTGYMPYQLEGVAVTLSEAIPVVELAEAAGLTYRQFIAYNMAVQSEWLQPGLYLIRVPPDKKDSFALKVEEIKRRFAQTFRYHVVSKGETVASIAKRYGVTPEDIKEWNQLKQERLAKGQKIKIRVK